MNKTKRKRKTSMSGTLSVVETEPVKNSVGDKVHIDSPDCYCKPVLVYHPTNDNSGRRIMKEAYEHRYDTKD